MNAEKTRTARRGGLETQTHAELNTTGVGHARGSTEAGIGSELRVGEPDIVDLENIFSVKEIKYLEDPFNLNLAERDRPGYPKIDVEQRPELPAVSPHSFGTVRKRIPVRIAVETSQNVEGPSDDVIRDHGERPVASPRAALLPSRGVDRR